MPTDIVTLIPLALIGLLVGGAVVVAMIMRPRVALIVFFGAVLLFEQYPIKMDSWSVQPDLYNNLNVTLGIGALKWNPLEMIYGLIAVGWMLLAISRPRQSWMIQTISLLGALYMGWMLLSVVWGVANGGNWKVALWILRPVFYFLATAFLAFQLLRTPRHVATVLVVTILCVTIKSAQIIYRYFGLGIEPGSLEAYGSHECTSFALYGAWFIFAGFFLRYPSRVRWAMWGLLPILMLGIHLNDRRINIATFVVGMALIPLLQSPPAIKRRLTILQLLAVLGFLYLIVGWFGPTNPITAPIKSIKEGVRSELMGDNTDNSSWYRKVERYNLRHTVKANPVLGTGLGVKYLQLIPLDHLSFEYAVYISHNQITLVHSATGTIGYFIFLFFFSALMVQLTIYWKNLREPWRRATALVALLSVMNWLIVGYYDMQLFFFRNSIFAGMAIALPAVLNRWQEEQSASIQEEKRGGLPD